MQSTRDLAWIVKTLFVMLLVVAFLSLVLGEENVLSQVRPTPPATLPAPTNTPPATLVPIQTPTGDAPTMNVSCSEDHDAWLCTVQVFPGRIAGLEVLAVANYGNWVSTFQHFGTIPDGWGAEVLWETIPNCSTEFAELRLMSPSLVHVRYSVNWHCNFLPVIY